MFRIWRLGFLLAIVAAAALLAKAAEPFRLRVESPHPARFYLTDAAGKAWTPEGAITYSRGTEQHFLMRGGFEIRLPSGTYTLVAERSLEYIPVRETFKARAGREKLLRMVPTRW